jgi:hypothetical protein
MENSVQSQRRDAIVRRIRESLEYAADCGIDVIVNDGVMTVRLKPANITVEGDAVQIDLTVDTTPAPSIAV